jgi:hypothetical protein
MENLATCDSSDEPNYRRKIVGPQPLEDKREEGNPHSALLLLFCFQL